MTSRWAGPPPPAHWTAAAATGLVGRQPATEQLLAAWADVRRGLRQVVLVGGDGGVGKSRLVVGAALRLAGTGAVVLSGACVAELGSPHQPFTEPVQTLASAIAAGQLAVDPAADRAGTGPAVPELVDRLALLIGRGPADGDAAGGREYRPQLYEAVVAAVRAAAAQGPVVLVLEDLHWAAPDGLQLLIHLVERTADVPVLVLATHRSTLPDRTPVLVHALARLYRLPGVRRLDLQPLGVEHVAEYLVRECGVPSQQARAAAPVLHHHSGGNPFLLRELWRDLVARGGLPALRGGTIRSPDSVRDTYQARLDSLPAASRRFLELAAVVGAEVDPDDLLALDACAEDPAGPAALLAALDGAVALGVLDARVDDQGLHRFRHALARQTVLDLMPPSRLARCHARAADVLEAQPYAPRRVQRLAYHCVAARALGYGPRAVRYLVEAARIADGALAHVAAAELFERAAGLPDAGPDRDQLLLAAARSHFLAGTFARAMELDEQVARTAAPRERLRAAIGYEAASWLLGAAGHQAAAYLSAMLAGVDGGPTDPLVVRGRSSLGRARAFTGDLTEAAALAEETIAQARALGHEDLLGRTLQAALHVGDSPESCRVRLSRARELSVLAERTGDLDQLCAAAYHRGEISYQQGDRPGVDAAESDLIRGARMSGQPFWECLARSFDYARHFLAGDLAAAEQASRAHRALARSLNVPDHDGGPFAVETYMLRRETGRLAEVAALITGDERPEDHWAPGLLALYTELGRAGPARRLLCWILGSQLERLQSSADWAATLAFLVEAAVWLEDEASARTLRPMVAEYAGQNLAVGPFVALFGSADRHLGSIDSLLRAATAEDWFASAREMDERMRAPVHLVQTLAAEVLHRRRSGAPAAGTQELVRQVHALAAPLGLHRVLRLVGAPDPVGAASGRAAASPAGLTARELEVLRLLAQGASNRGIAARLVISESTAANHVRSILTKTGSANRTQAARYATTHDLLEEPVRPAAARRPAGPGR